MLTPVIHEAKEPASSSMTPRPPTPPRSQRSIKQLEKRKNRPRSCYLCRQKDHKAAECHTNRREPIIDPDDEFKEPAWDPRYRVPEGTPVVQKEPQTTKQPQSEKNKEQEKPKPKKRVSIATRDDEDPLWEAINEPDTDETTLQEVYY